MEETPIYDKLYEEFENLTFMRDSKGRWTRWPEASPNRGWYQNSVGVLYHYDGVVWDNVPSELVRDLEFLGE